MAYCKAKPMACQYPKCTCGVSAIKCPRCGTEYFEAIAECDWCPEVKPEPQPTEESVS